ncbi:MAG: hybrid sensor histidine kinase/response regulator, partial [Myxococcales bacterium]
LEEDHNLVLAYNGQEALDRLAQTPVDLVVSDVMMPGIDGLELCRRIRADERLRHLPVILLTARGGTTQKVEGLDVGADDYIGKPFDPEELKARVRSLFELRRTTRALADKSTALEAALVQLHDEELKVIESEKLRTLGELAAGIFHELHNYMNIIANGAEPLREGIDDLATELDTRGVASAGLELDDLRQLAATVATAAASAKGVTTELKAYAYQDTSQQVADLNAVIRSTVSLFGKHRSVHLALSTEALPVEVVSTRLTQVFTNLIKNALEEIGEQGRVEIATRREGDRVVATVTDDGPGVPAGARGKLFEPFFTTKTKGQGLGLGLSLSRKVVNDFGGELRLDESYTGGARFVVSLPAHRG